jgi:four helix bundle protein
MPPAQVDHEKLDVYQLQLQFLGWVAELLNHVYGLKQRRVAETLDQLDRASLSVLLNITEGNGRRNSQQRVRFLDDARGSATECAACLDALVAKGAVTAERVSEGKQSLIRVVSMLSRLIGNIEGRLAIHEEGGDSRTSRSRSTRRNLHPPHER